MNIKAVIHKNWLPIAENFQTDRSSPAGVRRVLSANGTGATWGLLRQAHGLHKASHLPPQENPQSFLAAHNGHSSSTCIMQFVWWSDRAIIMHLGENKGCLN
jgi:hypothetical protein